MLKTEQLSAYDTAQSLIQISDICPPVFILLVNIGAVSKVPYLVFGMLDIVPNAQQAKTNEIPLTAQ